MPAATETEKARTSQILAVSELGELSGFSAGVTSSRVLGYLGSCRGLRERECKSYSSVFTRFWGFRVLDNARVSQILKGNLPVPERRQNLGVRTCSVVLVVASKGKL